MESESPTESFIFSYALLETTLSQCPRPTGSGEAFLLFKLLFVMSCDVKGIFASSPLVQVNEYNKKKDGHNSIIFLGFPYTSSVVGRRVLYAFIRMAGIVCGSVGGACINNFTIFFQKKKKIVIICFLQNRGMRGGAAPREGRG